MKPLPARVLAPLVIGLVTVVTYGVLIPWLGFYRDDWYLFVTAQSQGSAGIIRLFSIDRPLIGYFYALAYPVLDFSPLAWHLATLGLRLIGNILFWRLLTVIWPSRVSENLIIALLFSVYPGYSVQPNAGVYSTDLATSAAALLSLLLALLAMRLQRAPARILATAAALVLEVIYLGLFEAAIGLEVGRFALILYAIWQQQAGRIRAALWRALRVDLPYLIVAAAFLFWRLFIFQSTRRATNLDVLVGKYAVLPVRSVLSIAVESLKDIFETAALAWAVPLYNFVAGSGLRDLFGAVAAALAVVLVVLLAWRLTQSRLPDTSDSDQDAIHSHMMALGLVILVFALLPIDAAGRNVEFTDQWDRYTIYASAGAALLVGGAIFRYVRGGAQWTIILGMLAMSVMVHFFSAAWYRDFWAAQRDLWQQLAWRAPALQPGTMLFVELPVGGYQEGYEIYGPANMIYFPGDGLQVGGDVINASTAANLQLQKNRQHYDRTELVDDNYRNSLIAVYPGANSCLHVLDGRKIELPGLVDDSLVSEVAAYSRIEQIDPAAAPPTMPSFLQGYSSRPWCRYYQLMDKARQQGQWAEVVRLADEALAADITPDDVSEWMPAFEAYATVVRVQDMRRTAAIIRSDDRARAFLCLQLQRGAVYPGPYDYNLVNNTLCQAN